MAVSLSGGLVSEVKQLVCCKAPLSGDCSTFINQQEWDGAYLLTGNNDPLLVLGAWGATTGVCVWTSLVTITYVISTFRKVRADSSQHLHFQNAFSPGERSEKIWLLIIPLSHLGSC